MGVRQWLDLGSKRWSTVTSSNSTPSAGRGGLNDQSILVEPVREPVLALQRICLSTAEGVACWVFGHPMAWHV